MKIWSHTLVMNEERYVWFAIMSVIDYMDKMLIWDTGSTDSTKEIINEIKKLYPKKIEFRELGKVDINEFTKVRQAMLDNTKSDWVFILDGDEVWWERGIEEVTRLINVPNAKFETVVNSYRNVIGDIFHYQSESAGKYQIDDKRGHLTIRAMKNLSGLHFAKPHGQQGIYDSENNLIQDRNSARRIHLVDKPSYLHFTHMTRSKSLSSDLKVPKRKIKIKHELGISFPLDYYYPEAFFLERPAGVPSPWTKMDKRFYLRALLETPLRKVKRRIIKGKSGY